MKNSKKQKNDFDKKLLILKTIAISSFLLVVIIIILEYCLKEKGVSLETQYILGGLTGLFMMVTFISLIIFYGVSKENSNEGGNENEKF